MKITSVPCVPGYDWNCAPSRQRQFADGKGVTVDRLCGLVVRVSGYRYRGLGFESRRYHIFWVVVGLERGPLSLVRSIEELLE